MTQVVEIFPHVNSEITLLVTWCLWPGDARSQGTQSHGTDVLT